MRESQADFTLAFRLLADVALGQAHEGALRTLLKDHSGLDAWVTRWRSRLDTENLSAEDRRAAMRKVNPAFIPRNHRVEAALGAASERGDLAPFRTLLAVVQNPFDDDPGHADLMQPPLESERVLATFCGT
jgi:uncharacterized protein YdiU (UPF0061 family)